MGHGHFFCAHGSWVQKVPMSMGLFQMPMGTSKLKKSAQTRAHGSFFNGSWVFGHGNAHLEILEPSRKDKTVRTLLRDESSRFRIMNSFLFCSPIVETID